ncbi:hypothetical protein [Rufibacter roseus]|uniref:Uncharacterized protein n=1 Tax=Rufibacter roseus TaxID=1567108 RepID=A0ABW2DIV7_9BACT|nr:hypothetical protein [Rufibacter roseus]
MQSDNLENLFREKVEELQHTPPPQFNWTPEKSWEKLAPALQPKPRKLNRGFYWGVAAGLVLALAAGLSLFRLSEIEPVQTIAVTTVPAQQQIKPSSLRAKLSQQPEIPSTPENSVIPAQATTPTSRTKAFVASQKTEKTTSSVSENAPTLPEQQQTFLPVPEPVTLSATPAAESKTSSIKITVVLGAKTLAQQEALAMGATSDTPDLQTPQKKRKLRLRIQKPEPVSPDQYQLATTKPSLPAIGTRIKL